MPAAGMLKIGTHTFNQLVCIYANSTFATASDGGGYNSSDILAVLKSTINNVQRCTLFNERAILTAENKPWTDTVSNAVLSTKTCWGSSTGSADRKIFSCFGKNKACKAYKASLILILKILL